MQERLRLGPSMPAPPKEEAIDRRPYPRSRGHEDEDDPEDRTDVGEAADLRVQASSGERLDAEVRRRRCGDHDDRGHDAPQDLPEIPDDEGDRDQDAAGRVEHEEAHDGRGAFPAGQRRE